MTEVYIYKRKYASHHTYRTTKSPFLYIIYFIASL